MPILIRVCLRFPVIFLYVFMLIFKHFASYGFGPWLLCFGKVSPKFFIHGFGPLILWFDNLSLPKFLLLPKEFLFLNQLLLLQQQPVESLVVYKIYFKYKVYIHGFYEISKKYCNNLFLIKYYFLILS